MPVYKKYIPIPGSSAGLIAVCTALTDDENVFATIGTYYDASGDAQLCMTKQHQRVLVTFDLNQKMLDGAPPGLMVTPARPPSARSRSCSSCSTRRASSTARPSGVVGSAESAAIVNDAIVPELKDLGVKLGTVGILTISDTDTTQAQTQLDSLTERWKTERVDTVFVSSKEAAAPQFMKKLRAALPDVQLLADDGQILNYGQTADRKHVLAEPVCRGHRWRSGPTHAEYESGPNWKYCKDIYEKQTGQKAPGPDDVLPIPGGENKGNRLDTYGAINDTCQLMTFFHDIGDKVGQYLNNTNWVNTVNNFGRSRRGHGPVRVDPHRQVRGGRQLPPRAVRHVAAAQRELEEPHRDRGRLECGLASRNNGSTRSSSTAVERELDARAHGQLVDRAVDEVADEEHAFVEPHDHRAVRRAVGERGQRRRVDHGERPHLARAAHRFPRALGRAALRAHRAGAAGGTCRTQCTAGCGARRRAARPRTRRRRRSRARAAGSARRTRSPVHSEQHRARRVADRAAHERDLRAVHLIARGPPQLPHRFRQVVHAVHERLAVRPAVRVHRQRAVGPAGRAALDERPALAHRAEPVLLERERHRDRERLDDQRDVDVGGRDAGDRRTAAAPR